MYLEHFDLREAPFAITPDPRFVFLSERHREALAHLRYGIAQGGSGGFVLLTGDIGTGKTTLSRLLLEQLPPGTQAALLLNPRVTALELLENLCEELGLTLPATARGSVKQLVDLLNLHLLSAHARGEQVVVLVDEAQNLSTDALEQVRLLTNLETPTAKLLQVVLLGQPELRDVLSQPGLAQLAQRVTARYHLAPLDPQATESYLRHRLAVAGSKRFPFSTSAVRALHARSAGVPRRINIIADRALTGAYAQQSHEVSAALVQRAANEALGETSSRGRPWPLLILGAALVIAALGLALTSSRASRSESAARAPSPALDAPASSTAPSSELSKLDMSEMPAYAQQAGAVAASSDAAIFPSDLPPSLAQGTAGPHVEWLERMLAETEVVVGPAHLPGRYDAALTEAVRAAQRRFGLREDGIAGRETQWVLASHAATAAAERAAAEQTATSRRPLDSQPLPSR